MSDEKMFSVGVDPAERLQRDFIQKSEAVREQMTVNSHSEEDQGSSDCEKGTESAHEGPIGGVSYLPAETMVELQPDDWQNKVPHHLRVLLVVTFLVGTLLLLTGIGISVDNWVGHPSPTPSPSPSPTPNS